MVLAKNILTSKVVEQGAEVQDAGHVVLVLDDLKAHVCGKREAETPLNYSVCPDNYSVYSSRRDVGNISNSVINYAHSTHVQTCRTEHDT